MTGRDVFDDDDDDHDGPEASLIETVAIELGDKAEWRRGKARQYPDDERNLDAAELLDRLAAELLALEGAPAAVAFENHYVALFSGEDPDRPVQIMQLWSEYRSGIGFRHFPDSGEDVLADMIALATP